MSGARTTRVRCLENARLWVEPDVFGPHSVLDRLARHVILDPVGNDPDGVAVPVLLDHVVLALQDYIFGLSDERLAFRQVGYALLHLGDRPKVGVFIVYRVPGRS